jgi:hypothetical protein
LPLDRSRSSLLRKQLVRGPANSMTRVKNELTLIVRLALGRRIAASSHALVNETIGMPGKFPEGCRLRDPLD